MSTYDDMADLDDHFKQLARKVTVKAKENKALKEAWGRISGSHADLERYQMKTEEAMQGFASMLRAFNVKRNR